MKPTDYIVIEAAKRGIVPGARIKCASELASDRGIVAPYSDWILRNFNRGSFTCGLTDEGCEGGEIWGRCDRAWATVLTPAPQKNTLKPGMATICGPAMRTAIMERAKELGIWWEDSFTHDDTEGIFVMKNIDGVMLRTASGFCPTDNTIPLHEFLRLMENTKPPKKELTTEEKLAEAVRLLEKCYPTAQMKDYDEARDFLFFLKSIKP